MRSAGRLLSHAPTGGNTARTAPPEFTGGRKQKVNGKGGLLWTVRSEKSLDLSGSASPKPGRVVYAVNGILAKAENSRLEEKLQQAQKSAAVWKQRYESLKEQARPYLEAVKLAPEKVRAFLDAILTRTRQTRQHDQPSRRKSQDMEL